MPVRLAVLLSLLLALCAVPGRAQPPSLMLARDYQAGVAVGDYWVSEKFDGVRGRWDGRALWTRGGGRIAAPDWFVANWPPVPMDGELWIGRGRFDEVSALVRAQRPDDAAWRRVRFMVFDLPAHPGGFDQRLQRLRVLLAGAGVAWLRPVPQQRFADAAALEARLQAVVSAGGEGLMLHHRHALYRAGRSDGLLKLKPWQDAEARVVGHTAGRGKYAGMLGALVVERPDGLRFRLGSGLSDAQRASPPAVGSHVTYRYNGLTGKGVPRFARFLRVRHELPPPDPE
ncbi:DNA ligase [uncultured Luteimonas sp.]|uniref:DNA ligase n=1 Tax=uncultured Luteimonas sp. TaxID=453144 RepID=UPI0026110658|nr:DNA ligase [uncultured Luteimonas sp.]